MVLTNPHLPRQPADGDRGGDVLAVLAVLRDRPDLLDRYDERRLVNRLPYFLLSARKGSTPDKSWRADDEVTAACKAMLGDVRDGPIAELLCEEAARGSSTAIAVVTASRLVPADEDRIPAFLFMTRQWRRYEAADPGGRRLRAYIAELDPHDGERDRLCAAARAGDRPEPCEPAWPSWATTSPYGSGGGHGVTGSGSYFDPGGGFSVHGV